MEFRKEGRAAQLSEWPSTSSFPWELVINTESQALVLLISI